MKEMEFEMFVEPLQASLIGECKSMILIHQYDV